MIDLQFEQYSECKLKNIKVIDSYQIQQWSHYVVTFEGDIPEQLNEPEALVIANSEKEILEIILREEGCDSPMYQFTEKEKEQLSKWFNNVILG